MAIAQRPVPTGLPLYDRLRKDPEILELIARADRAVASLGYTDHGRRHVHLVAVNAARVLGELGYDDRARDLAAVGGLLHDIGNVHGRDGHAAAGALMAHRLLTARGVSRHDAAVVRDAIANHDEVESGEPVSPSSAALIVADKADIHRSRVRTREPEAFDIHDRVNYAVLRSKLEVLAAPGRIELQLEVDSTVASGEELAELFAVRFAMSGSAAQFLGCAYVVDIRGNQG